MRSRRSRFSGPTHGTIVEADNCPGFGRILPDLLQVLNYRVLAEKVTEWIKPPILRQTSGDILRVECQAAIDFIGYRRVNRRSL